MFEPDSIRIVSVAAFVILFALGMIRPVWAPVAYMILVYCKLSSYYPVFGAMKAELLFAVIIVARILLTGDGFAKLSARYNALNKYLYVFVICVFISFAIAWDRQYSWDNAVYHFIKVLILYIMILIAIDNQHDFKIFVWSFLTMFAYLAYEPTYGFITGTGGGQYMYGVNYIASIGILSGHVALANNMNQMIPIAFYLIFSIKKRSLIIIGTIPLFIFVTALVGSGSRGGIVGFAMFCLCLVYFSKNRLKTSIVVGIISIFVFIGSGQFSSTMKRIDKSSTKGRLIGLTHGIEMIKRGNVLGVGPGCFLFARRQYFSYRMEAHNIYGQVFGDLGIPGTIAWLFLILQIFRNIIAAKDTLKALHMEKDFLYKLAMGVQVSLIVRLFISMASHGLYYFYWYIMAAFSIILSKLVEDISENKLQEQNLIAEKQLGKYQPQ